MQVVAVEVRRDDVRQHLDGARRPGRQLDRPAPLVERRAPSAPRPGPGARPDRPARRGSPRGTAPGCGGAARAGEAVPRRVEAGLPAQHEAPALGQEVAQLLGQGGADAHAVRQEQQGVVAQLELGVQEVEGAPALQQDPHRPFVRLLPRRPGADPASPGCPLASRTPISATDWAPRHQGSLASTAANTSPIRRRPAPPGAPWGAAGRRRSTWPRWPAWRSTRTRRAASVLQAPEVGPGLVEAGGHPQQVLAQGLEVAREEGVVVVAPGAGGEALDLHVGVVGQLVA